MSIVILLSWDQIAVVQMPKVTMVGVFNPPDSPANRVDIFVASDFFGTDTSGIHDGVCTKLFQQIFPNILNLLLDFPCL